jgi:hypothetical protein
VPRVDGTDVEEGEETVILEDLLARDFSGDDSGEGGRCGHGGKMVGDWGEDMREKLPPEESRQQKNRPC